jgi:hypothetical protein
MECKYIQIQIQIGKSEGKRPLGIWYRWEDSMKIYLKEIMYLFILLFI